MNEMQIKIGSLSVHETGTVVGVENEPIDFILDPKTKFIIRLSFFTDKNSRLSAATANKFSNNGVEIKFTNYNNSLGHGNVQPLRIGRIKGKVLYLNYRIYSFEKGGKLVHYTFMTGEEVTNA